MVNIFSTSFYKKVVYFFTNECQPFGLSERHLKSAAKNAEDLRKHGNDFAIFPLITAEQKLSSDFNTLVHYFFIFFICYFIFILLV